MNKTKDKLRDFSIKLRAVVGSRGFFWGVVGFFVFQAVWIALSAAYPQAFDENFHFGIIQVYSHHWLPFLNGQPPQADAYGAVARDPSYLYHYLLSFPYRVIALFIHGLTGQVIALRLINVALFTASLPLFRRVLTRTGISAAATNLSLFIFTLIPIAPQVAGQVNYDNLLVPLTAVACLLTFMVIDQLKRQKPVLTSVLLLFTVCLLATLTKYEFLPIFAGIVIFVGYFAGKRLEGMWRPVLRDMSAQWRSYSMLKRGLLLLMVVVAIGMFLQRDGHNLIKYHSVAPECDRVLTVAHCKAYDVWAHDYASHQALIGQHMPLDNPFAYLGEWVYWLWFRLFFAIAGPEQHYVNYPPLPLPAAAFAILTLAVLCALAIYGRQVFARQPYQGFLGTMVLVYLLALLGEAYLKYRATGVLELMNGRYLLPILLPAAAIGIRALTPVWRKVPGWQGLIMAVVLICFLEGGGVFTFLSRSDQVWDWNNPAVRTVNNAARRSVTPWLIDGPKTYTTHKWFFN